MGDCRIRIILANDPVSKDGSVSLTAKAAVSITRMYSADTTVREVAESTHELWELYSNKAEFQLWDCTVHPPKNITDWPMEQFSQVTGPQSKTLHDAGWFPSGTWMVLPPNVQPSQFNNTSYEDFQYNQEQERLMSSGKVQFTDASLMDGASVPLPSQVMASVAKRFEEDSKLEEIQIKEAHVLRHLNQVKERKRRLERAEKLDNRIQCLEALSSEKTKKVSEQVRRMLVKSRATGDKRLEQQDRLYFECLLDLSADNEALHREFRFFSRQDTFAKIASSFERPHKEQTLTNVEVLVKRTVENGAEYRRFPVIMRAYEAISGKFLTGDLDTIVVRWFSEDSDATPSILDIDCEDESIQLTETTDVDVDATASLRVEHSQVVSSTAAVDNSVDEGTIEDEYLTAAIKKMDAEKGKNPKKGTAASTKVRHMVIKSKARGDSKRIPKIEDRFFLEAVVFDKATRITSSNYYFLAHRDPLERILQSMVLTSSKSEAWDFLVAIPQGDGIRYRRIRDPSIQLSEATSQGILNLFDRLILRPR